MQNRIKSNGMWRITRGIRVQQIQKKYNHDHRSSLVADDLDLKLSSTVWLRHALSFVEVIKRATSAYAANITELREPHLPLLLCQPQKTSGTCHDHDRSRIHLYGLPQKTSRRVSFGRYCCVVITGIIVRVISLSYFLLLAYKYALYPTAKP